MSSLPPGVTAGLPLPPNASAADDVPTFGVPVTEAERVRARGVRIILADGTPVLCRFDLEAMWKLEQRLGSVAAVANALQMAWSDQQVGTVIVCLSMFSELSVAETVKRIDQHQIPVYADALDRALAEALPRVEAGEVPKAPAEASTGAASTTSEPSSTGEPTPLSGG